MGEPRYKEQYARVRRYFDKLIFLKNEGSIYRDPEVMTSDELAQYGLTTADRDRIREWIKQIPPGATTLDATPVGDILTKWFKASANDSPDFDDAIYTFFQNCYFLKDWIKNDPDVGNSLGLDVETFINSSKALSICADICNGSKHLLLTSKRSGYEPIMREYAFSFNPSVNPPSTNKEIERRVALTGVKIEHGETELDAFDIADQCMKDWKRFLGE